MQLKWSKIFPIIEALRHYDQVDFKGDLSAGLTVGVMLIPQGMAYAMLAGLPQIHGLYAATIPLIIYAIFGTSRQLAVGPVAMISLLTTAGVAAIAQPGTSQYIQVAILMALIVGGIQLMLGVFRLGFLSNFLSHPIISGFTSAAALIIGLSQLKHLLGINIPRTHHIHELIQHLAEEVGHTNMYSLGLGLGGMLIILFAKKLHKAIPVQLVAVVFGIVAVRYLGLTDYGVKIVGDIPAGLPHLSAPVMEWDQIRQLLLFGGTISIIGFMESYSVARAIQTRHRNYEVNANQELIALGLANIGASFSQAYPVAGGFGRSAVNDRAGARTPVASIISALLLMLILLFFTPLFYFLPNAILAAIIIVAVAGLVDWREALFLWKANKTDFILFMITFAGTLLLGIERGIAIGVVLSLVMVILRVTRPHVAELGKVPGTIHYRNVERFPDLIQQEDTLIVRFDAQLFFANAQYFKERLFQLAEKKGDALRLIIINAESMNQIDSTGIHTIKEVVDAFRERGVDVVFAGVKGPVRDALVRGGVVSKMGDEKFYMCVEDAVNCICRSETPHPSEMQDFTSQTNVHPKQ